MNNSRLLLLGFSCTELGDGYSKKLIPDLRHEMKNIEVFRCGLGGLHPPVVPSVLKNLYDSRGPFTHVVFEISTSAFSWLPRLNEDAVRDVIYDIITLCQEIKVAPIFLFLFRKKHKPTTINLNSIIVDICQKHSVPYIDLAEKFEADYGAAFVNSTLRDVVHTNVIGGALQSDLILWRLIHWMKTSSTLDGATFIRPKFRRVPTRFLDIALGDYPSGTFSRRDYERDYLEISHDRSLDVFFENPKRIMGFSFEIGPQSGFYEFTIDDGQTPLLVKAYDQRSYYPRLGFKSFNTYEGREIRKLSFRHVSGHENVKLLRGLRDANPPKIRLLDIVEMKS